MTQRALIWNRNKHHKQVSRISNPAVRIGGDTYICEFHSHEAEHNQAQIGWVVNVAMNSFVISQSRLFDRTLSAFTQTSVKHESSRSFLCGSSALHQQVSWKRCCFEGAHLHMELPRQCADTAQHSTDPPMFALSFRSFACTLAQSQCGNVTNPVYITQPPPSRTVVPNNPSI